MKKHPRKSVRTAGQRPTRSTAGRRRRSLEPSLLFPRLGRRGRVFGTGVLIAVAECQGGKPAVRIARRESFSNRAGEGRRSRLLEHVDEGHLARVLAGVGQRHRIGVMRAILSGANTHAALAARTGLAAGPLYHHLRSLERAGLVKFVERNRYDVSPLGRDLILLVTVACSNSIRPSR